MHARMSRAAAVRGIAATAFSAAVIPTFRASADTFPDHPITMIIPFDPGGGVDQVARLADKFAPAAFGHNFTFQYQPGAGGALGVTALAHAKPDGYTIGGYIMPNLVALPLMHAGQFTIHDFTYVAQLVADPHALVTLQGSPYTTLPQFIAAAKASPGKLTVGLPDVYDGTRFSLLDLQRRAKIQVTTVPFNGGNKQNAALLGKVVDAAMVNLSLVGSERDKLNFLAISTPTPFADMPKVPTFRSYHLDVVGSDGRVYMAPKGVPADIAAKLSDGFKKIADNPEFKAEAQKVGIPVEFLDGPGLEKYVIGFEPFAKQLLGNLSASPAP